MTENKHRIQFVKSGRGKAQCAPDPDYPEGVVVDGALPGAQACSVALPYPAPECGFHHVECLDCGRVVAVTAAGRPDDPRAVIIPCKGKKPTSPPSRSTAPERRN